MNVMFRMSRSLVLRVCTYIDDIDGHCKVDVKLRLNHVGREVQHRVNAAEVDFEMIIHST